MGQPNKKRARTMLDLIPDDVITTHIVPCLDEVATLKARIAKLELEGWKKVSDDQAHWGQGYGEAVDWVAERIAGVIKGDSASPAEWVRTLTEIEDMSRRSTALGPHNVPYIIKFVHSKTSSRVRTRYSY